MILGLILFNRYQCRWKKIAYHIIGVKNQTLIFRLILFIKIIEKPKFLKFDVNKKCLEERKNISKLKIQSFNYTYKFWEKSNSLELANLETLSWISDKVKHFLKIQFYTPQKSSLNSAWYTSSKPFLIIVSLLINHPLFTNMQKKIFFGTRPPYKETFIFGSFTSLRFLVWFRR